MPFDLIKLLGRSVRDPAMRKVLEYFEETPRASERDEDLGGCYSLPFYASGFSLVLDAFDVIGCIHIRTQAEDGYCACTDGLPLGLSFRTSQAKARKLFGPPTSVGGPLRRILPPKDVVYWDRWEYADHTLHLMYSERRDAVLLITLEYIPALASDDPGSL